MARPFFAMPTEYEEGAGEDPLAALTDEERKRFLEQYNPSPVHTGAVTRGTQGFAPLPSPRGALAPDREGLVSATPPPTDDLMSRFMAAQQKGAGNAAFANLGGRLDNYARVFAGIPERQVETDAVRARPAQELMQAEGVKSQQRNLARQTELDGVNLAKTKAETARAEAQAKSTAEEAAREAALADMNSPETQAERRATAALLAKNPNVTPELLASLNGIGLRNLALRGGQQINAEAMAGIRQTQLDMTGEQQAFQRQMEKWRLGLETERLAQQWDISQLTLDQQRELAELRNRFDKEKEGRERATAAGNKVAADTKDISEAFDKSGAPNFYAKHAEVSELLAKHKDDIPGYGKVDGLKPDIAVSDDALALRQGIGQMLAEYRKGITGAGMSNTERTEYGQITGLIQSNNERSVRQGVERLKAAMDARVSSMAGGYRPEAVATYAKRVPAFGAAVRGSPVAPSHDGPLVGTAGNPAPPGGTYESIPSPPLPARPKPVEVTNPANSPATAPVQKLKPGQKLVDVVPEGEFRKVPMGNGEFRIVVKRNGKLKIVEVKNGNAAK